MVELATLLIFVPTIFFVSATPGMCMTLAMTLGMSIGLRRTFWMMWGEMLGVGLVASAAILGVASVMLNYPQVFVWLKYLGGAYLLFLASQMWRAKGKMAISSGTPAQASFSRMKLASQGFITAIANPKGWAFCISLLPPFINEQAPVWPQLLILVSIILVLEFICMTIYATGGRSLKRALQQGDNVQLLNRISATLMAGVGIWLALG